MTQTPLWLVQEGNERALFSCPFPSSYRWKGSYLAHLELLVFIVALKAWPHLIANTKFGAHLDNIIAVSAINSGHPKDPFVNAGLQ